MPRIAIIGLVGKTIFMEVPRFHEGGETIVAKGIHEEWGGKGFNQAIAAARQDAAVSFLGAADAADAKAIAEFCRTEGVTAKMCVKKQATACATILTDGTGETHVTVYPGAQLSAKDVDGFAGSIATADFLILNNEVPEEVNLVAVEIAKRYGVKIIFNPAPVRKLPKTIVEAVSIFTPNEFEEEELVRNSSLFTYHSSLAPEVITTLGARGCRIRSTGEVIPAPTYGKPVDSTGAGDTFNAVLATRLSEGETLHDACVAANAAAAQSVSVKYVIPSLPYRNLKPET